MKKTLVIFSGLQVHYKLAEYAVEWCAKNGAALHGLFMEAREKKAGYGFPSDLALAENLTNKKEAQQEDEEIIRDYEKVLLDLGKEKNVPVASSMLLNPSLDKLLAMTEGVVIVFVDASFDKKLVGSSKHFNLEKFKKLSHAPVQVVADKNVG